jgi:hypothetical protein
MAFGFNAELPPKAIAALRPGDLIFVETFDCWLSWAVMYMTRSEISHAAIYLGNGLMTHATLGGVVEEPLASLYDASSRLLPCILNIPDEKHAQLRECTAAQLGRPYGWRMVLMKACRILLGRLWPLFRWAFVMDLAVLTLAMDAIVFGLTGRVVGVSTTVVPLYLMAVLVGWVFWKRNGYRPEDITPDMLLYYLNAAGNEIMMDAYEVSKMISRASATETKQ